jgi:tRNA(fMet)-specific endonuclease VapC
MIYLLDTNVCIAAMKGHALVQARLRAQSPADCGISTVTLYELHSGIVRCRQPLTEKAKVDRLIQPLSLIGFDEEAAKRTAEVRWFLEKTGQVIGPYDLMLAGTALVLGLILVTHNTHEFKRVPGLIIENWQV